MTGGAIAAPAPILSLIACSRNDRYMGNSLWRLETTLNYLGQIVQELARQEQVEVVIADWGSNPPLAQVLNLHPGAARITRFLSIPAHVARELEGDSEFPEVLALNAAARRAGGEYIGRIDQDTLVGRRLLEVFFDLYEGRRALEAPLGSALLFSNRRRIPYRFAVRCPPLASVRTFVALCASLLKVQNSPRKPIWRSPVGIWLVHRQLWAECGGYDERMIYLNDMEENMVVRLMQRYSVVDLGRLAGHCLYHLEHKHPWDSRKSARNRRVNDASFKTPAAFLANDADWGLQRHALECRPARAGSAGSERRSLAGSVARSVAFAATLLAAGSRICLDLPMESPAGKWLFRTYRLWRDRSGRIRDAVAGRPASSWPAILVRMWIGRGSRP